MLTFNSSDFHRFSCVKLLQGGGPVTIGGIKPSSKDIVCSATSSASRSFEDSLSWATWAFRVNLIHSKFKCFIRFYCVQACNTVLGESSDKVFSVYCPARPLRARRSRHKSTPSLFFMVTSIEESSLSHARTNSREMLFLCAQVHWRYKLSDIK